MNSIAVNSAETTASTRDYFEIVLLGAIWGASFMFTRIAAPEIGEIPLVFIRLALAGLVLAPFLYRSRALFRGRWGKVALIGSVNSLVPFLLYAWATKHAPAGIMSITNALTVVIAVLVGALFFGQKVTKLQSVAVALGLFGVVALMFNRIEGVSLGWPVFAGVIASGLYGVGAHLLKRHLSDLPSAAVAGATLSTAALMVLPFAVYAWPTAPVSPLAWGSVAVIGVLCTGIAYMIMYRLIARIGANRAATNTYLIPLFGVLWSWMFLGEQVTPVMIAAGLLILFAVALTQGKLRLARS